MSTKGFRRPGYRPHQTEDAIEEVCRQLAAAVGWGSRKMNGLGFRSWPDRLFLPPKSPIRIGGRRRAPLGRRFWVEFKKPGEESTEDQTRMQNDLRERGESVYTDISSKQDFLKVLGYESERDRS